jgi:protein ImuB
VVNGSPRHATDFAAESRPPLNLPALYACLYVREFPAQAMLRLRPNLKNTPVAVLEGTPPRQTVCSRNLHAATLGIDTGLTRAELDVFPGITHLLRSVSEEAICRDSLLQCAGRFSPRVECLTADPRHENKPDKMSGTISSVSDAMSDRFSFTAILDIAGTEKLFGAPPQLAKKLHAAIRHLSIHACVVVSTNIDAALCLARSLDHNSDGPSSPLAGWSTAVIPNDEESTALAPLPISVLPFTPDQAETLNRWGIFTLGALAALPEKELVARLGQSGRRLRQLARGEAPHLLVPADPPLLLEERTELDAPIEILDSLLFVLGVLLDHLIARATAQILALASVTVALTLEGGSIHTRTVRPALPGNDRSLWLRLLHLDLQAHPPSALILAVTLTADPGSTSKVQQGLFTPQLPEPDRLDVTLARIRSIIGQGSNQLRVGRAVLEDNHRPDAFHMEPFSVSESRHTTETRVTTTSVPAIAAVQTLAARRRFRPPEPIAVTLRDRHPVAFVFRNQRYTVERAWGPWFFSGNWWGIECWSMEKWDLVARSEINGAILSCAIARNPLRPSTLSDWRIEELYD